MLWSQNSEWVVGAIQDRFCLFCYGAQESRVHLFFRCSFSRQIWNEIMADCSFLNVPLDWESIEDWCLKELKGKSLKANLGRLCLRATVYHLWKQRNNLLHNNTPRTEEALLARIRWEARARIVAKGHFKHLRNSISPVSRWNWRILSSWSIWYGGLLSFWCWFARIFFLCYSVV
jgi:hypothetical protein